MKLLIDGTETKEINLENESKQTLLAAVKDHYKTGDRIIVFVKNEKGDRLDFFMDDAISNIDSNSGHMDLVTATPKELALVSIYDSAALLENVKKEIKQASELLITGDFEKGMLKFSASVNGISAVIAMVEKLKGLGYINYMKDKDCIDEFMGKPEELNKLLSKIEGLIKDEDMVGISDLLEYELFPVVEAWQGTMPALYQDVMDRTTLN
jgi:hypothetical protein